MDKQNVIYLYNVQWNVIQQLKEMSTDTRYSMDEPWERYAE